MTTLPPQPVAPPVRATSLALPSPDSLPRAAQAAAAQGKPLVVMTTLKGCAYCDVVRGHYLGPMQRDGEVVAVQLDMTDKRSVLQGFNGAVTTPHAQVKAWKAPVAPTVLFLGPHGEELAERLVGIAVQDMYGDYLQMRLNEAARQLAAPRR